MVRFRFDDQAEDAVGTNIGGDSRAPTTVRIEEKPSFSNQSPEQFRQIRIMTKDAYGFSSVASLNTRVERGAEQFRDQSGRWPTALELWNFNPYQTSISVLASGTPFLPPVFVADGERWINDPWVGPNRFTELDDKFIQSGRTPPTPDPRLPSGSLSDWIALAQAQGIKPPGVGGGGGGGGAGRAPLVFDRAELNEGARERWRGLLLEEPDDTQLSSVVGDYMTQASGFWTKEAGRLDFDTFVVDRIRKQARYDYLYDRKPEFQSEAEYLSGFRNAAAGFGLAGSANLREVEAGAHAGVGLAGFTERVGGVREVRTQNAGAFSQRLAASASQMGLTQT